MPRGENRDLHQLHRPSAVQKQTFDSFEEFLNDAKDGTVKTGGSIDDWLPPKLLHEAAAAAGRAGDVEDRAPPRHQDFQLVATLEDGTRMTGTYGVQSGHAVRMGVDVDDTGNVVKQSETLSPPAKRTKPRRCFSRRFGRIPNRPRPTRCKLIAEPSKRLYDPEPTTRD